MSTFRSPQGKSCKWSTSSIVYMYYLLLGKEGNRGHIWPSLSKKMKVIQMSLSEHVEGSVELN